jgi:hypothetical protein
MDMARTIGIMAIYLFGRASGTDHGTELIAPFSLSSSLSLRVRASNGPVSHSDM